MLSQLPDFVKTLDKDRWRTEHVEATPNGTGCMGAARRGHEGRSKESVDAVRSLSADRRQTAKTPARKDRGDRGDRRKPPCGALPAS